MLHTHLATPTLDRLLNQMYKIRRTKFSQRGQSFVTTIDCGFDFLFNYSEQYLISLSFKAV